MLGGKGEGRGQDDIQIFYLGPHMGNSSTYQGGEHWTEVKFKGKTAKSALKSQSKQWNCFSCVATRDRHSLWYPLAARPQCCQQLVWCSLWAVAFSCGTWHTHRAPQSSNVTTTAANNTSKTTLWHCLGTGSGKATLWITAHQTIPSSGRCESWLLFTCVSSNLAWFFPPFP